MHEVLVNQFIASFNTTPKRLTLDFDATDDPVHGNHDWTTFLQLLRPLLLQISTPAGNRKQHYLR